MNYLPGGTGICTVFFKDNRGLPNICNGKATIIFNLKFKKAVKRENIKEEIKIIENLETKINIYWNCKTFSIVRIKMCV